MVEKNEAEREKEKRIKRNEDNIRDLWDNVKCPNIQIIGVPEEEDKKKGHEKILEEFLLKDQLLSLWGSPCELFVVFPLLLLIFVLCV